MSVVGIDQSANHSGVTVLADDGKLLEQRIIEPGKLRDAERLAFLREELGLVLERHADIHLGVLEGYSYGSVSKKFILGEVGAIVKMCLFDRGIQLYAAAPTQLKKFTTGKTKASKQDVMRAVEKKWGVSLTDDNLADSYGLARIGLQLHLSSSLKRHELEVALAIQKKSLNVGLKPRQKRAKKTLLPDNI